MLGFILQPNLHVYQLSIRLLVNYMNWTMSTGTKELPDEGVVSSIDFGSFAVPLHFALIDKDDSIDSAANGTILVRYHDVSFATIFDFLQVSD